MHTAIPLTALATAFACSLATTPANARSSVTLRRRARIRLQKRGRPNEQSASEIPRALCLVCKCIDRQVTD